MEVLAVAADRATTVFVILMLGYSGLTAAVTLGITVVVPNVLGHSCRATAVFTFSYARRGIEVSCCSGCTAHVAIRIALKIIVNVLGYSSLTAFVAHGIAGVIPNVLGYYSRTAAVFAFSYARG